MKTKAIILLCLCAMLCVGSSCSGSQIGIEGANDLYLNIGVL